MTSLASLTSQNLNLFNTFNLPSLSSSSKPPFRTKHLHYFQTQKPMDKPQVQQMGQIHVTCYQRHVVCCCKGEGRTGGGLVWWLPEWVKFVEILKSKEYNGKVGVSDEDVGFDGEEEEEFVNGVRVCLAFAKDRSDVIRSLSRKDIVTVVDNGSPFLFKGAADIVKRMKTYLGSNVDNGSEFGVGDATDLMKFLLSYASNRSDITGGNNGNIEAIFSVRNLFKELAGLSRVPQFPNRHGEAPRPLGQNITRKRGEWICSKCSLMNIARNMKCFKCNQARPEIQLTGAEWECPQCDFFNHGKNVACLRCDCNCPTNINIGSPNANEGIVRAQEAVVSGKTPEKTISQGLDRILNRSSTSSEINRRLSGNFPTDRNLISETNKSGYVPFVPFPADMFEKPQNSKVEEQIKKEKIPETAPATTSFDTSISSSYLSEKPINKIERKEDKEQAEKSERWSKKVAELHDVADLASAISDEDFPDIMPIRKGENRFVVSKPKDRSLTSPMKRMAVEQPATSNFVPFVPFPSDYFAKTNKDGGISNISTNLKDDPSTSSASMETKDATLEKFSSETQQTNRVTPTKSSEVKPSNGDNWKGGFSGKSLEGSLVTEPDPLDMSEEAKAQRWFRRAAQIKDISELSQIPDEDFPEIMPMRKGVNRFVVSKRKTPLERRLTSPQYRRNLPTVSSEPVRNEERES